MSQYTTVALNDEQASWVEDVAKKECHMDGRGGRSHVIRLCVTFAQRVGSIKKLERLIDSQLGQAG